MKDYTPRPGSVPAQVIDYLRKNGPTRLSTIARALKKRGADLFRSLKAAMSHQLIFSAGAHGRVTVLHLPDQDPAQALAGAATGRPPIPLGPGGNLRTINLKGNHAND